jgi:hypothetical protein
VLREPDVELEALLEPLPLPGVRHDHDRVLARNLAALRIRRASRVTLGCGLLWAPTLAGLAVFWIEAVIMALGGITVAAGLLEVRRAVCLDEVGVRWRDRWRWKRLGWTELARVEVRRQRWGGPSVVLLVTNAGTVTRLRALAGSWLAARDAEPRLLGAMVQEELAVVRARRALATGTD